MLTTAESHGVKKCGSPAEVGRHAEVVIVMVATDAQVEDAIHGLLDCLAPGAVICIASSIAPDTCRRMAALAAERGIGVLDTPVVLGQEAANNGALTGLASMVCSEAFRRREISPMTQFDTSLGWPQALAADSKKVPTALDCVISAAS